MFFAAMPYIVIPNVRGMEGSTLCVLCFADSSSMLRISPGRAPEGIDFIL